MLYCKISDELASFIHKPFGTIMAYSDVRWEINQYILRNELQNGRFINPDKRLKELFKLNDTDVLSYFNLQKYISKHVTKAEPPEILTEKEREKQSYYKQFKIFDELAEFFNKESGTIMTHSDVSHEVLMYVRKNELQNIDDDVFKVYPDAKIRTLMNLNDDITVVDLFDIIQYVKCNFLEPIEEI